MSDALIVSILALAAVAGAGLSFLAWHKLARRPERETEKSQFDSDGPDV